MTATSLRDKLYSGARITPQEALTLFDWDLLTLGRAADARRRLAVPGEEVGFVLDRIVNFTNRCEAACAFCAFHARADQIAPYDLTDAEIHAKVAELVAAGGTQVMLQGGLHPDYTLDRYVQMVRGIKERFPGVYLHSFSPAEVVHMARKSGQAIEAVVAALKAAGLDSMPGASDLLVERVRRAVSPKKTTVDEWRRVIRALAAEGMGSSATMTYGMGESPAERVEHLRVVRDTQDAAGNLRAFIPWSFSPARTRMPEVLPATGVEYLRVVAVARIFLDNIVHIQAGWLTEGLKLAQVALAMGADDMGGVLMEEVVVKATGIGTRTHQDELVRIIQNAGKIPVQRDSTYRVLKRFEPERGLRTRTPQPVTRNSNP